MNYNRNYVGFAKNASRAFPQPWILRHGILTHVGTGDTAWQPNT